MLKKLKAELDKFKDPTRAKHDSRYFKTGKGQYGEGDIFLGIKVPVQRQIAKKYKLPLEQIQELLSSKIHEHRLVGLFILIDKYKTAEGINKKKIFDFYLANTKNINNWDLIDLSSHKILGDYLINKDRRILHKLSKSDNLWKKRISIISTFAFIRNNEFQDTLKIAEILLKDTQDLIHKAVGWMLREVGKRNQEVEEDFLKKHYKDMPRTMLRYAIEKFDEKKRKAYLNKEI